MDASSWMSYNRCTLSHIQENTCHCQKACNARKADRNMHSDCVKEH